MIMGYMNGLLMIFSVIFLFYTNSFLIKRRKREIGIYNILGMGKGHIAKMLAIEAVITAFISQIATVQLMEYLTIFNEHHAICTTGSFHTVSDHENCLSIMVHRRKQAKKFLRCLGIQCSGRLI